jgi:hypothetical protein
LLLQQFTKGEETFRGRRVPPPPFALKLQWQL